MLTHLHIQNIAIVDEYDIDFSPGFTVLLGETGAGKSIIFLALSILLGKTSPEGTLKHGCDSALIEGEFSLTETQKPFFLDYLEADSTQLIVSRKFGAKRTQIRLNGHTVTLKTLVRLSVHLAAFIGQHDQLLLCDPAYQLHYLDRFCGEKIDPLLVHYRDALTTYRQICTELETAESLQSDAAKRDEFIRFKLNDINQHGLKRNEDSELENQKKALKQAVSHRRLYLTLLDHLASAKEAVIGYQTAYEKGGAGQLALSHLDEKTEAESGKNSTKNLKENSSNALENINDMMTSLEKEHDTIWKKLNALPRSDDAVLDEIESRLHLIEQLKTKSKCITLNELLDYAAQLESELAAITSADARITQLIKDKKAAHDVLKNVSLDLFHMRQTQAKYLAEKIQSGLADLALNHAVLTIEVSHHADHWGAHGADTVQMLFSANPGTPAKPLSKVASGGELSRLYLAMKSVMQSGDVADLILMDEVDTGVSGVTATKLAKKMKNIAQSAQVICITHLPQVARLADHHFKVEKQVVNAQTVTAVYPIRSENLSVELDRMIGL